MKPALALGGGARPAGWNARPRATPGIDEPPLPQPARPIVVPAMVEQALANGLTVTVSERHDLPLVSALLLVRAGPELDPPDRAGLAALTATLATKGAQRGRAQVSASAIAQQAEALGGTIDSASGWRASTLAMTVTTTRLPAALALIADLLRRPTLAADELERARAQALDALRLALADPGEVAAIALRRAWWGASPYGASASAASLAHITRADLQRAHAQTWGPARSVLVLAGDITPSAALALADRMLGDWRDAGTAPAPLAAAPPQPLAPALLRIDLPGAGQCAVAVAAPFAAIGAPERRIAQVGAAVLGGGYSARLNQKIRVDRGLSYGAYSQGESQPGGGMLAAYTQTRGATAAEVLGLMRDEVAHLADAPPAPAELAARQAALAGAFARRMTTTAGLAGLIAGQYAQGRPPDELRRRVDEIMAVTPEQVRDYARTHWTRTALRATVVGDLRMAGTALDEPGALTLPVTALDLAQPGLPAAR